MSMRTVIVLSALSETTLPRRTCGEPGPWSAGGVPSPFVVFFAPSCPRRRRRPAAFCRRRSRRSSGVDARRRPRFARVATRRSCGVIGGGAGSAGAAGAAGAGGGGGRGGSGRRGRLGGSGRLRGSGRHGAGPLGLAARHLGLRAVGRRGSGLLGRDGGLVSRRGSLDGRPLGGRSLVRRRLVVLLVCHHLSNRVVVEAALARDRQGTGEVALRGAAAGGVVELAGSQREAQAEGLAPLGADVLDELVVLQLAQLLAGHETWSSRCTNLVFTGSLCPARRIASRASGSGTPASSNITRPGLTTATQPSGEPLPEPMRVSAGFFVTGLSG